MLLIRLSVSSVGLVNQPRPTMLLIRLSVNSVGLVNQPRPTMLLIRLSVNSIGLVNQPCPTLCNPMDCSPPDSSLCAILKARILEWVAIPFSRGSSQPRDRTWVCRFFTIWATLSVNNRKFSVNNRLLMIIFWGSQKFYVGFWLNKGQHS